MQIRAKQLRQIAAICEAINAVEHDDDLYNDSATEATLINTKIDITERETGRRLGIVKMGSGSDYVFVSA